MTAIWQKKQLSEKQNEIKKELALQLDINMAAAALLVGRGIDTAEKAREFIRPSLDGLHDPFLFNDMQKAVERLDYAIKKQEKILIYGDYDVDGITAVALIYRFLHAFYSPVSFYIPDRYTEGYGISFQGIDYAQAEGFTLVIALDCGIKSIDKVEYAKQKNIDFIICDHHMPDDSLPDAVAVLDAKRPDNTYPFTELSGCGVGFKLVQAYARYTHMPDESWKPLLELCALSTACDIVSMTGENRVIEYFGLKQIRTQPSIAFQCLISKCKIDPKRINVSDFGFKIGPRINASGRMKSGAEAVKLLISEDRQKILEQYEQIDAYNLERKEWETKITEEAFQQLHLDPDNEQKSTSVVCQRNWHKGVLGIVASRLTEVYYRPTIVLSESADGIVSGSARSAGGFDIYMAIDSCRDLLTNYGGHPFAAGVSMKTENYPLFKERFEAYVTQHILPEQKQPIIKYDEEIRFSDVTPKFFRVLECLEPFGPDNERPVFVTRGVHNHGGSKRCGKDLTHLKLDATDGSGEFMSGIAFGQGDFLEALTKQTVAICYRIEENEYKGQKNIQMQVQDIQIE